MSNSITIHIGDKDPHQYWQTLRDHLHTLHLTALERGWIGKESGRDMELNLFMADLYWRLNERRPPRIPTRPGPSSD